MDKLKIELQAREEAEEQEQKAAAFIEAMKISQHQNLQLTQENDELKEKLQQNGQSLQEVPILTQKVHHSTSRGW